MKAIFVFIFVLVNFYKPILFNRSIKLTNFFPDLKDINPDDSFINKLNIDKLSLDSKKITIGLNLGALILLESCACVDPPTEKISQVPTPHERTIAYAQKNPFSKLDSDSGTAGNLKTVYFPYKSAVLDSKAKEILDSNIDYLIKLPHINIILEGHADYFGGKNFNSKLAYERSFAIYNYLIHNGIPAERLKIDIKDFQADSEKYNNLFKTIYDRDFEKFKISLNKDRRVNLIIQK